MIRRIEGLAGSAKSQPEPVDGEYLVRIARAQYRWDKRKPYYAIWFEILKPLRLEHRAFAARIYCSAKALWKLNWFLHDFGYDPELLGRGELDELALAGLEGVVKISHQRVNGTVLLNLDGFARAEIGRRSARTTRKRRWPDDLQLHSALPFPRMPPPISLPLRGWLA